MLHHEKAESGKDEEKNRKRMETHKSDDKECKEKAEPLSRKFCEIPMKAGHTTQECYQNPYKKKPNSDVNEVGTGMEERSRLEGNRNLYNPDRNMGRRPFKEGMGRSFNTWTKIINNPHSHFSQAHSLRS